jgi:hypothetical protein
MNRINTYNGIDCAIAFSPKTKRNRRNFNPLFWVCMITLPLVEPTIVIQFLIIFGSLSHKNPPLNMDLPIILILLIFYNITFSPSHPNRINCKVLRLHMNKLLTNNSWKGMYAHYYKSWYFLLRKLVKEGPKSDTNWLDQNAILDTLILIMSILTLPFLLPCYFD